MNNVDILACAWEAQSYMVEVRRHLHRHPELGLQETETAKFIRNQLDTMGIPWIPATQTGTIGIIRGNGKCDKVLGLRADIDALPVTEEADVDFRSENPGVMHACGHDTHTAMLLGAAKIFQKIGFENIPGTIWLVFQPGEETTVGAKEVIDSGAMQGVDAMFALHIMSPIPANKVYYVPGYMMAGCQSFQITFNGRGGHGSDISSTVDPILPAAMTVVGLESIITQNVKAADTATLCIGKITSGVAMNVVPDTACIEGNFRYMQERAADVLRERIVQVAENTGKAYRTDATVEFGNCIRSLYCDPGLTEMMRAAAVDLFGEKQVAQCAPVMGSEDFSAYGALCPLTFAFLGTRNSDKDCIHAQHNCKYKVDEDVFPSGAALHVRFAMEYFNKISG